MMTMWKELRLAARSLMRRPGFAAVLLGIAAGVALILGTEVAAEMPGPL